MKGKMEGGMIFVRLHDMFTIIGVGEGERRG